MKWTIPNLYIMYTFRNLILLYEYLQIIVYYTCLYQDLAIGGPRGENNRTAKNIFINAGFPQTIHILSVFTMY